MHKRHLHKIIILTAIILITLFGAHNEKINPHFSERIDFTDGLFYSCHLDVGQGDCSVVKLPDNRIIMIDTGLEDTFSKTEIFLKKNGIDKIDYLVASHPHSDHIGSMAKIVKNFEVGEIYMPKATSNTVLYENLLLAIKEKGLKIKTAAAGVSMISENGLTAYFAAPSVIDNDDHNNCSSILLIKYKNTGFLYTGDSEEKEEKTVTADISADVLKVAHHGSRTSNSDKFLDKVNPKYAVISCGADNSYGHPHYEVLKKLKDRNCKIFRTDETGTVIIKSNGEKILE